MYCDLHVHSVFSDGELIPSEIARRMADKGVNGFAITDHADFSNVSWIMERLLKLQEWRDDYEDDYGVEILFGVEITHVPPRLMDRCVELARSEGAEIVVVHGETLAEPVAEGTNESAVECDVDILAHPGIISADLADRAWENGVYLELSARKGHCLGNGCVARYGRKLVINTDTHSPGDIISEEMAIRICRAAGVENPGEVLENNVRLFKKLRSKSR